MNPEPVRADAPQPGGEEVPGPSHGFPCPGCGATLEFDPGAQSLKCPYCDFVQELPGAAEQVEELDYERWLDDSRSARVKLGDRETRCAACGAITASTAKLAQDCPFCGAPLPPDAAAEETLAPNGVLPFRVARDAARAALRKWIESRWFAPSSLKKLAAHEGIHGVYVPHYTFDAYTRSFYSGARGEHYYVTVNRTVRVGGRNQTRSQRVRRTRWYPASGRVQRTFDDVLVPACSHLPDDDLRALEPWGLKDVVPFDAGLLAGFEATRHTIELAAGFSGAQEIMRRVIDGDCRRDIGGDEQQVHSVRTSWSALRFKLLLLPVWIAAYRFRGKVYRVLVNARTGEVQGDRPWSAWKIAGAALLAVAVVFVIVWIKRS